MTTLQLRTTKMLARKEDGVGWMTFNNPERLNAMAIEMNEAIPVILGDFAADPDVRVVVMHGAGGKAFVSGADISEFESRRSNPEQVAEYNAIGQRATEAFLSLGKPLIAMIQGYAVGGGLLTALKADLRVASEGSQFGVPAVRLGLGYGYEGVKALVDLVGPAHARYILITGSRVDAQTALRMGLVNQVTAVEDLEASVREMAKTIANNAPLTVKSVRNSIAETLKDPEERDLEYAAQLVAECFASEDYIEGRHAFMEKRRPVFHGH